MAKILANLLIPLGLIVLVALGYFLFVRDDASMVDTSGVNIEEETERLLASLEEIKQINVDADIFSDQRFLSLEDYRLKLWTEPFGRSNPFLPVR